MILYDDRVLIFYNTDANHPTVVNRDENEEMIAESDDLADVTSSKTKKNSLEPKKFKRVSLGGEEGIRSRLWARSGCVLTPRRGVIHCAPVRILSNAKAKRTPFGVLRWRRGRDSNPCALSRKLISSQPRYDHFDTSPYMFTPKMRETIVIQFFRKTVRCAG